MNKSDLVTILETLTLKERDCLVDFLQSPYYTKGRNLAEVITLIGLIYQALANGESEKLEKMQLYSGVYPAQPYIFNKLEKLASETLKWVRRFIEVEMREKAARPEEGMILRAEFMMHKGLDSFGNRIWEQLQAKWAAFSPHWDSKDYYLRWVNEKQKAEHLSKNNTKKDDNNLRRTLHALNEFYLLERLKTSIFLLNQNRLVPIMTREQCLALSEGLDNEHFARFFEQPVGQLFRSAVVLLSDAGHSPDENFEHYYTLLNQHASMLPEELLGDLETIAYNFCVPRYHRQPRYREFLYELLQKFIQSGRVYHNGMISAGMFQSIMTILLLRKEYDQALQFLEKHRHCIIGGQNRDEYYLFNLANYYFHIARYEKALDILLQVSYEEMQYKFSAKILEIKILYETDSPVLDSKIDAAKVYFYREQTIPLEKKEMYGRFVDFMRRMIHPQTAFSMERISKLQDDIHQAPPIAEWPWLIEKVEALMQPFKGKKQG
jgi:hypothetical protein